MQSQLISNRLQDNNEIFAKLGQLKNEIKKDFNYSWGIKISDIFSQFASSSEQIITGYDELKNEIGLLRGQIKILQEKLEGQMKDQHIEVLMNFSALQKDQKVLPKLSTSNKET